MWSTRGSPLFVTNPLVTDLPQRGIAQTTECLRPTSDYVPYLSQSSFPAPRHYSRMDHLSIYARRPIVFLFRYVRRRPKAHAAIFLAVLAAVGCSVSTQYAVKSLVDALGRGPAH